MLSLATVTVGLLGVLAQASVNGKDRGGIAAKINGEIVTWDEVEIALRAHRPQEREQVRQATLLQMAETRLYIQFAKKYGIVVTEPDIDEAIKRDKKLLGGDENFERSLRFRSMTLTEYREDRRRTLLVHSLYRKLYLDAIRSPGIQSVLLWETVSPEEVKEYYLANRDQFTPLQSVTFLRIGLLWKDEPERELKRRVAESLLRKLAEGTDFLIMAAYYSETLQQEKTTERKGPWYLDLKREQSEFSAETTAFLFDRMKEGEVSPILEDRNSINLFRMERRLDRKAETFEEAQVKIRSQLEHQRIEQNRNILRSELLKQSYIEPPDLFKRE